MQQAHFRVRLLYYPDPGRETGPYWRKAKAVL